MADSTVIPRGRHAVGPSLVADLGRGRRFSVWVAPEAPQAPDEEPPERVVAGRYELRRSLGSGAMGEVWSAVDRHAHRLAAVKLLRARALGWEARVRFAREATLLARFAHPHIVRLYDYDLHGTTPFIAMELCRGEPLDALLARRRRFCPVETAAIVGELGDALDAVHRQGIVHRDVKPSNVIVDGQGQAKIVDFGIAKPPATAIRLTVDGALGTAHYTSPEQHQHGWAADARSDVWSLAVTAYQLLTGALPFDGPHRGAVTAAIMQGRPPPVQRQAPDLPAALDPVFDRALCPDPRHRPASAGAFAGALRHAVAPLASGTRRKPGGAAR